MSDQFDFSDMSNSPPQRPDGSGVEGSSLSGLIAQDPLTGPVPDTLLALPPAEQAKRMNEDWDRAGKDDVYRQQLQVWKVNRARSRGYTGVRLIKEQNSARAYFPLGAVPNSNVMNKALRLRRRVRAYVFSDPPLPEAIPASDEDRARDSADFSTRVLRDLTGDGNLGFTTRAGDAFDMASDYGSGFLWFYIDPTGGGWVPVQILASPLAQTADAALINPATNQPYPKQQQGDNGDAVADIILRYVRRDGSLTDNRADPDLIKRWLPRVRAEALSGKQVRPIPMAFRDIDDAEGVQIGQMVPLSLLKRQFPKVAQLDGEALGKLTQARPQNAEQLLPSGRRDVRGGEVTDDSLVFVLTRYHLQSAQYPRGCYAVCAGDDTMLVPARTWFDDVHGQPLDIPIAQFRHFFEEGNGWGVGLMDNLGPGNELRALFLGAMLEHLDRFGRRKTYLPYTSNLQPEQLQSDTATVLPIIPGTQPQYEQLPDFPQMVEKMHDALGKDLDDESGLPQGGNGPTPPSVRSAEHAELIVQQVTMGLAELVQNTTEAITRSYRIVQQLVRAFYQTPQRIRWAGEDGSFREREWTGADLAGAADARILKGSFTQLAPAAKAQMASQYATMNLPGFGPMELRHALSSNLGGQLGLEDDPHELRVRRQIDQWREGPPQGWRPPAPVQAQPGQPAPPPAPDPVLSQIFDQLPVDTEPSVALIRAYELGRAMASKRFSSYPAVWRAALQNEYLRMRQALAPPPPPAQQPRVSVALKGNLDTAGVQTAESEMPGYDQRAQAAAAAGHPPQDPVTAGQAAKTQAELERTRTETALAVEKLKLEAEDQTHRHTQPTHPAPAAPAPGTERAPGT